jgi:ribosomal protein S12 methylthiotransferase accessory factor
MGEGEPRRDFRAMPSYESGTCAEDLAWLLERLREIGIAEVVEVDLTREEFGIAVVRVVIPGLEGPDDHDRYAPGPRVRRLRPR